MGICQSLLKAVMAFWGGDAATAPSQTSVEMQKERSLSGSRIKYNLDQKGQGVQVRRHHEGSRAIEGTGVAVASLPIEQDSAYWEVKVLAPGKFAVGVARTMEGEALEKPLGDKDTSWALDSSGLPEVKEDDVVGCVFAQSEFPMLRFFHNGKEVEGKAVDRVRGLVYPAVYVSEGASLAFKFFEGDFVLSPPNSKYPPIMESRDMI